MLLSRGARCAVACRVWYWYWYIFQYHMKIILAQVYLLSRTLTYSDQNTDSQKIKIMLQEAQLINIFKDVFIKCSKFPLFRIPGFVDFLKSEDFYPRDSGFFQICGFFKSGDFYPGDWGFLTSGDFYPMGSGIFENLGIFIPGGWEFLVPKILPRSWSDQSSYKFISTKVLEKCKNLILAKLVQPFSWIWQDKNNLEL